jgi:hypothetical protein
MPVFTSTHEMHDASFVAGANYGPYNVPNVSTITRVQIQGCLAFASGANQIGNNGYLSTYIKAGWQAGPVGFTPDPISTAAGRESSKWFWYEEIPPTLPAYWTDETTANLWSMERYILDMQMRVQLPSPNGLDLYWITGAIIGGPPPGWMQWGTIRITYCTTNA